jgi:uncharacterized protein (TIGR03437 family)
MSHSVPQPAAVDNERSHTLTPPADKPGVRTMKKILLLCGTLAWALPAQTVTVTATPSSATFNYQIGTTALPAAQTITVKASSGTPTFTATSPAPAAWLTVSPATGRVPGSLTVRVNPTSLTAKTYVSSVTLTVTGVAPVTIPVTLVVTPAPSTLTLSATSVLFATPPNPPATQTVTMSTNGAPISFTATSGSPWLTVNGAAQTITIYGTNFYGATLAKVKGVATSLVTTTFKDSSTFVQAVVPASMLTAPTILKVLVSNPAPGGDSVATVDVAVVNAAIITAVVNAASYATGTVTAPDIGTVSPGELVSIYGTNLGPTTPAPMSITGGGFVDTVSTSGVAVTVDGTPAPLIYVSETQINVQVPYEAAIGTKKVVSVTNGANPPVTASVTVAPTAPGLFTADGSGSGQVAALNYNATTKAYTFNNSTTLAKTGDTVILYLTGEGIYDSAPLLGGASDTGFVIPPGLAVTPQVSPLPTVSIGGVDATPGVAYAGPIVGSIIGVLQINVKVPAGSTTGTQVPVSVTIGANGSQAGTTLAVHP